MGYDYGCQRGGCAEKYRSLNSPDSNDMTDVFKAKKDNKNILAQVWSRLFNVRKDEAIGFGMSKTGMMTFKFDGNIPVRGVVCSTNSDDQEYENEWVMATCDTVARGNTEFDGIQNTNIKVKCPSGCLTVASARVWGVEMFKDDSSICRAAIHNGRIKPEDGGLIEVGIESGQSNYKGSESNGIKSEEFTKPWDRSFVVNTYVRRCPMDEFQTRLKSSFIQIGETATDDPGAQQSDSQGNQGGQGDQQGGQSAGQAAPQTQNDGIKKKIFILN
jgi:hypothetical protein